MNELFFCRKTKVGSVSNAEKRPNYVVFPHRYSSSRHDSFGPCTPEQEEEEEVHSDSLVWTPKRMHFVPFFINYGQDVSL